jgi:hypothetical protein
MVAPMVVGVDLQSSSYIMYMHGPAHGVTEEYINLQASVVA